MITELYIAKRLQLNSDGDEKAKSPSLTIATIGIVLAITVMILSLTIVSGFKHEIENKVYSLDSHIKVMNANAEPAMNMSTIYLDMVKEGVYSDSNLADAVRNMSLIAEQPVILKTDNDFKGVLFKGVDENFDWHFLGKSLVDGRLPNHIDNSEIIVSKKIAIALGVNVGDRIYTHFVSDKIKTRKNTIVGIYNTDFDEHDSNYIIGDLSFLQNLNRWENGQGGYIGINLKNVDEIGDVSYDLFSLLAKKGYLTESKPVIYNVTNTHNNNSSFFSWLDLLDINVVIIIILMAVVSAFTLISVLLMIILERIRMIGLLKTLGSTDKLIRKVFIYLTHKIIIKSILLGNALGLLLAFIQKQFHVLKLDSETYYMPYVPIEFNWLALILLNVFIVIISYITLLGPSHIISSIKPNTTLRYE